MVRIICSVLILLVCSCKPNTFEIDQILGGEHKLRKINIRTINSISASYFLISGHYDQREKTTVRFYFLNYRGEYMFMEKRIDEVLIKTDSLVKEPYVKFFYYYDGNHNNKLLYYRYVTDVVIYCNDNDFQPEININDFK